VDKTLKNDACWLEDESLTIASAVGGRSSLPGMQYDPLKPKQMWMEPDHTAKYSLPVLTDLTENLLQKNQLFMC